MLGSEAILVQPHRIRSTATPRSLPRASLALPTLLAQIVPSGIFHQRTINYARYVPRPSARARVLIYFLVLVAEEEGIPPSAPPENQEETTASHTTTPPPIDDDMADDCSQHFDTTLTNEQTTHPAIEEQTSIPDLIDVIMHDEPKESDTDLLFHIHGLYRLLDLINEQGSGGAGMISVP